MQELIEAAKRAAAFLQRSVVDQPTVPGAIRVYAQQSAEALRSTLSNAETHPALRAAGGWRPSREEVARVLAPEAFAAGWDPDRGAVQNDIDRIWNDALAKAQAILALGAVPEGGEEREAARDLGTAARDLGGVANLLEHRMGTEEDRLVHENSRQAAATCRSVAALLKALVAQEVTG